MKRRNFVNLFIGGSLIGTICSLLYPVARFLLPSKTGGGATGTVVAAKVGELAPNSHKIFRLGNKPGILIHSAEGELKAFSAICTHLTCTVTYQSQSETILCPCHNGRFDLEGRVISGPPPSALEKLRVEISGEDIIISKQG